MKSLPQGKIVKIMAKVHELYEMNSLFNKYANTKLKTKTFAF